VRASIRDAHVLAAIRPLEFVAYLRAKGWHQVPPSSSLWSTWIREGDFELTLPLERSLGDFALRMADALRTLEIVEDRSQIEILSDLLTASADVLRLRVADGDASDGTLPLEHGAQLVANARDLMMAGACAAIAPRAIYQTRKPQQAMAYLRQVRLGQTELGSYTVTVISRVPPGLEISPTGVLFEIEEPFERRVTTTLSIAVSAVRRAAELAASTGRFEEFQAAVPKGVSANLCDAIFGLAGGHESERSVEIGFSWAQSRPLQSRDAKRIVFPRDMIPVIEEAARLFRETSPQEDFELRGPVVKLERAEGAAIGRVTVLGFIDGQPRKVFLELPAAEYHKAVQAHDNQQTVSCRGSLIREGSAFMLRDPCSLDLELDD